MTNIYIKQMKRLGLNVKQYAQLLNMPYEVVRDFIYRKEGDYSMGITDMIRRNMINKHQEIEQDNDNAKIKALEIKQKDYSDFYYLNWYQKVYNVELLKRTLNIKSLAQFEKKYCITTNYSKASNWTYQILLSKRESKRQTVDKKKKIEFIKQLYDIIENKNGKLYKNNEPKKVAKQLGKTSSEDLRKWYKKFDIKTYKEEHNITNGDLSRELDLGICTISHLVSKNFYTDNTLEKLYNYIKEKQEEQDYKDIAKKYVDEEILDNKEVKDEKEIYETVVYPRDYETLNEEDKDTIIIEQKLSEENLKNECELQQEIYKSTNTNDEILRKLLINRLTEEEKMLIELFGGKIC